MAPEWLPVVDVRRMHLEKRNRDCCQSIAERHAGVSQPPGIDDAPRNSLLLGPMHAFDQGSLMVALKSLQGSPLAFRDATEFFVDARKGFLSVDPGFTGA